jgi:DNA-binding transcriptional MocR family regulator
MYIVTMTMYRPNLEDAFGARYRALAQAIIRDIEAGRLDDGMRLPPQRELALELGVTIGTVSRAYALVERQGLVSAEVGRGTFVRRPLRRREEQTPTVGSGAIDLTMNTPADRGFRAALRATLADPAVAAADDLLDYPPRAGLPRHRAAASRWLARSGVEVSPERMILTGGAHQALITALATLCRPGEVVLAEALAYAGLRGMVATLGLQLEPVPIDADGVRPDALDVAARQSGARVLVVNPTLHNPTTATWPDGRRRAVVDVTRRHDLVIVEDDVYGLLKEPRPTSLWSLAPERTVHVTSVSKTLAPGLRLGILAAPAALYQALANTKYDLLLAGVPLPAEIFQRWLDDGTADRLLERQRREAAARQAIARAFLRLPEPLPDPAAFHIWLPLPAPWRTGDFVVAAAEAGVAVAPGQAFATGRSHAPHAVRLSLSAPETRDALQTALARLAALLAAPPPPSRGLI